MKNLISILLISISSIGFSQTVFSEDFENGGSIPTGWTQEYVVGPDYDWVFQDGGYLGHPSNAHGGSYNALFTREGGSRTTKLITPEIDLSSVDNPKLTFWYAQEAYDGSWDELRVYYKTSAASSWVLLEEYSLEQVGWAEKSVYLPNKTATYYVAFEGETHWGYGVCIDDVKIDAIPPTPKFIDNIYYNQADTNIVVTESVNNPILRIDFDVGGNSGTLNLNSIEISSNNIDDNDIAANGVKLYRTTSTIFKTDNQLGSAQSFSGGVATFSTLAYDLPPGMTYVWVCYDIATGATPYNTVDAKIEANKIDVDGSLYPSSEQSPAGSRTILEKIYADDFDAVGIWTLSGEFEWGSPQGKGGDYGNADPTNAHSGTKVIGTDLTGLNTYLGDYEPDIGDRAYTAISPAIDCFFFTDVTLRFYRWLNIESNDNAYIDISTDNGSTWTEVWDNPSGFLLDNTWMPIVVDLSSWADQEAQVKIRFSLGTSNNATHCSGWNIDDVVLTGNFISDDVGVAELLSPASGCGLTNAEDVSLIVKNYGGAPSNDTIPVGYSVNGGGYVYDIIYSSIPVSGQTTFTFGTPVDLSVHGAYYSINVATFLPDDENTSNDALSTGLYADSTFSIPFFGYNEDFETANGFSTGDGYWRAIGDSSSWEFGNPNGATINSAASGVNAWVTNLTGNYNNNESSYLQSPCFDFTIVNTPVFEFNIWWDTETSVDGAALQYSINDGLTWNTVGNYGDPDNWYNNSAITALNAEFGENKGWSGNGGAGSGSWVKAKHFLPPTTANQPGVKFRVIFASNNTNVFDGFGIDDVCIYDYMPDVSVSELVYPISSCELTTSEEVTVYLHNSGNIKFDVGDTILISYEFNYAPAVTDTIILTGIFYPDSSLEHTFVDSVDMSNPDAYDFVIYSKILYYSDVNLNNDTLYSVVDVGYPVIDLGPDIYTVRPDTVVLNAYLGPGYTYLWQDASADSIFNDIDTSEGAQMYYVTVTNSYGCSSSDSVQVTVLIADIGVTNLISPQSACELGDSIYLDVQITNFGTDTMQINDTIFVAYTVNIDSAVTDTFQLDSIFYPGDTIDYTFLEPVDMTTDTSYYFNIYTLLDFDNDLNNDTLYPVVVVWGFPVVDLGPTIYTKQPDTVILDAGPGYASYQWQDVDSTNQTYHVDSAESALYYVDVIDTNGCGSSDTIQIIVYQYDVGNAELIEPVSNCELSSKEAIKVKITNVSPFTINPGDTVLVGYVLNDTPPSVVDTTTLADTLFPDSSFIYTFVDSVNMSAFQCYEFILFTALNDTVYLNYDSLVQVVCAYGYPAPDLGPTIFTGQPDTIVLYPGSYDLYLWQDNSTDSTFQVTDSTSAWYYVTVTEIHPGSVACVGLDSIQIIVYDVGITELVSPVSDCELSDSVYITVQVTNFCPDTFPIGVTIILAYELDTFAAEIDTFILGTFLYPQDSIPYTFNKPVDMTDIKSYNFKIYTILSGDVDHSNDTLIDSVEVYGYPYVDLGPTIYTGQPDTVVLYPGEFASYLWQDSSTDSTFSNVAPQGGTYYVTVTDSFGCPASDSIKVKVSDVGVSEIITPVSACELTASEQIRVKVKNFGADTLKVNEVIIIAYEFNGGAPVTEALILGQAFYPGDSVEYSFSNTVNMSAEGTYDICAYTKLYGDVDLYNDTSYSVADVGYPTIDLGPDIYTLQPDTVVLNAYMGPGFTYLWQDSSTDSVFYVAAEGTYYVTVTSSIGCPASDSIQVLLRLYDVGINNLILNTPPDDCGFTSSEEVKISVINFGPDTIEIDTEIPVAYELNGAPAVVDVITVPFTFNPGVSFQYTFFDKVDMSAVGTYNFTLYTVFAPDINLNNDTIYRVVGNCLNVNNLESQSSQITVYPNPTNSVFNIIVKTEKKSDLIIELMNIQGQIVYRNDIKRVFTYQDAIDVSELAKGMYYLRVNLGDNVRVLKLIVQ